MNRKIEIENEVTENQIKNVKKNIGMSVDIAVVNTAQKWNRKKLLNRKKEI